MIALAGPSATPKFTSAMYRQPENFQPAHAIANLSPRKSTPGVMTGALPVKKSATPASTYAEHTIPANFPMVLGAAALAREQILQQG